MPNGTATYREPVAASPAMRLVLEQARRIATSQAAILILGQTGVGKGEVARYIHHLSRRAEGPFSVFDCGALPDSLIEGELFGHRRGAFTGAVANREGRLREADGGTLFLDEIGELPLLLQTRFLGVLQRRRFFPVGSDQEVSSDFRLISATNKPKEWLHDEGRFRQDLRFRIEVCSLEIPPLAERREDIVPLAEHFLQTTAPQTALRILREPLTLAADAREWLEAQAWLGNVRELENVLTAAVALADEGITELTRTNFPATTTTFSPALDVRELERLLGSTWTTERERRAATTRMQRALFERVLEENRGNEKSAARALGTNIQTLRAVLRRK